MSRPSARRWPWNWARVHRGEPPAVGADDWVSVTDAARMLGTRPHRVENLIAHDHLEAAVGRSDDLGTTLASVGREIAWRRASSWRVKAGRAVRDAVNWI